METHEHVDDVELRMLRASVRHVALAALVLLALQIPMWSAVGRSSYATGPATTAGRLSLLLDTGFAIALAMTAVRACEYLRGCELRYARHTWPDEATQRRAYLDGRYRRIRWAATVLVVAALLDVVENVVLWQRLRQDGEPLTGLWVGWLSPVWLALGLAATVVLCAVWWQRADERRRRIADPMDQVTRRTDEAMTTGGTIIACSGGGIRSASFCLGALQSLMTAGVYRQARAVVGVSGGGYMAAAFHWTGRTVEDHEQPPFEQGTTELALLRRHTRYLLPRGTEVFRGVMSVLYGVVINVVFVLVALRAISWLLGWYLHEYDVVQVTDDATAIRFSPWWVAAALLCWGLAVGSFLLVEKVIDRFGQVDDRVRRELRSGIGTLLAVGAATTLLMLGVPLTVRWLTSRSADGARLPHTLRALIDPGPVSSATLLALLTGLVALARTVATGLSKVGDEDARLARLVAKLRLVVAPWLGTVLILAAAYLVLVRWTFAYATSAGWRSSWSVALWCGVIVLGVRLVSDVNRTSLHHFYRERLATTFLVERRRGRAVAEPYAKPLPVSEYAAVGPTGGPELVMAAVANVADAEYVPAGRGCVPFVIAADRTGVLGDPTLPAGGTRTTDEYERSADYDLRDLTLPASMAISGAAVSPLAGRASARTRPVRVLLTVLNARLGVWLPNPYARPPALTAKALKERAALAGPGEGDRRGRWRVRGWELLARTTSVASKPGPYRLLREAFGRPSLYDRRIYVTDGGHYDNLGLLEALRRRPNRVVVIDASNDKENTFGALADAVATARMDLGIEVTVDTARLRSTSDERAASAWTVGTATYPPGADGMVHAADVIFVKAVLTDGLSTDLEHYALDNPDFPRRSTGDQSYDEWDFEAYRQLGRTLADDMVSGTRLGGLTAVPLDRTA
ncbi:hypothetical protein PZ938_16680 [Luteipulveratus sp. YIM 133132]|uniref:hypothetical protein n=1 Tax=Luteipulveratus flavus TaxID=3031728 RepID=UPI0023B089B7|nr:hypothetical protein [Luteipulveratus sp. YIM 133132]MDE9367257.1 hypothetical protein [Luteipulveratus sp. YIM 133132]